MDDQIYRRPRDYDLEHENDDEDVAFHVELTRRARSRAACSSWARAAGG